MFTHRFPPLCAIMVVSVFAVSVRAQPAAPPAQTAGAANPAVRLLPANAQTLADALRQISKQTKAAFVCEGKPFRVRSSAPPLLPVIAKWPANGLPLDDAVSQIAAAYDYDAERSGSVFLLRKRYTNPEDLPDIPAEELRLSLRDAVRAASGLPAPTVAETTYADSSSLFAGKFYQSLTSAQISHLVAEKNGFVQLPVSELTAAQKQMMQDLVISRHIQSAIGGPGKVIAALRECSQESTAFGWGELASLPRRSETGLMETQTVRVLCCMVRENSKTVLVPFAPDGRMRRDFFDRQVFYRGPTENPNDDRAAPTPADYDKNGAPLPPPNETGPDTFTLAQLANALTSGPHGFAPHSELAPKSVTVVGISGGNAEALWRGAGAVYGLHVFRAAADGPLVMERPRPKVARSLPDLNAAVFSAFPVPLIRLFRGVFQTAEADRMSKPSGLEPPPGASESLKANLLYSKKQYARDIAGFDAANYLKVTAYHRFRVLLEPRLKDTVDGRVLYRDLDAKAHDLWTLALTINGLENASKLETETLDEKAADFSKGYLTSHLSNSITDDAPTLNMTFWLPNREGRTYRTADVGKIPLPDSAAERANPPK